MKTEKYEIRWYYSGNRTSCGIKIGCGTIMGGASCSNSDKFKKDTGRKLSLARAMKNASLSKEERTEIWEAYRTMGNKKRW